jgi:hypothetical protein
VHPLALIAGLVGALVIIAVAIAVPIFLLPALPGGSGLPGLRGQSAPSATEDYLHGNQTYNAQLVWNSLDSDAQARLASQGGSQDDLQQELDAAKQHGVSLEEISYIGGKALPDGTSMQFYLVGIRQQPSANIDYQPYMFTLDSGGKIAKVQ